MNGKTFSVHLISYEENQFNWAEDYLISGSVDHVRIETGTGMIVYDSQSIVALGDTVELDISGQKTKIEITSTLSDSPFRAGDDGIIIICSEETLRLLTGINDYGDISRLVSPQEKLPLASIYVNVMRRHKLFCNWRIFILDK